MSRVLVFGATGYIGGSVAHGLRSAGHEVSGLCRSPEKASALEAIGIRPILGSLGDAAVLAPAIAEADVVVHCADADDADAVDLLLGELRGTGKTLLHTSGSSTVCDRAAGEPSEVVYDEDSVFEPDPLKAPRIALDELVLRGAQEGFRPVVISPSLVYGRGLGMKAQSIQVPLVIRAARAHGKPLRVGRGLNIWSTVHIQDLVDLYLAALERAQPGSFYYAASGEASFRDIADQVGIRLGLGDVSQAWDVEDAIAELGFFEAVFAIGANSRVSGTRAQTELGWSPQQPALLEDLKHGASELFPSSDAGK